jgi:hypothetical protein
MAKKAQLKRGAAAMKKGAEGKRKEMPSGKVEFYFKDSEGGNTTARNRKSVPKGAVAIPRKAARRWGDVKGAYGVAPRTLTNLNRSKPGYKQMQAQAVKRTEGPKQRMPRAKKK